MQVDQALSNVIPIEFKIPSKAYPDIALMQSIAEGDRTAMRALYNQYRIRVYRFALRLTRNRDTAEDIVSDVFLEVWRHAGRFEARSQLATWLLSIARNLAWSRMRRHQTDELSATMMEEIEDTADTPERVTEKNQQNALLAQCLTKLSPAHREVIDLVYYHGMSVSEVSEITGTPQATVKTRMHYARLEIANHLKSGQEARGTPHGQLARQEPINGYGTRRSR